MGSDWTTVVVAAISAGAALTAGFGGVTLQNRFARRADRSAERQEAYAEFMSAAESLVLQAAVWNEELTLRSSAVIAFLGASKILAYFSFREIGKITHWLDEREALIVAEAMTGVLPVTAQNGSMQMALAQAVMPLSRANISVSVVGTRDAREAAELVLGHAEAFVRLAVCRRAPWRDRAIGRSLRERRAELDQSIQQFVNVARRERPKKGAHAVGVA